MRFRAIVALAFGLALVAGSAFAQSIDIYLHNQTTGITDFGTCMGSAAPFTAPLVVRVYAQVGGIVTPGLSGAEMFIKATAPGAGAGSQPVDLAALGWTVTVSPNSASSVVIGNPILTSTPPPPDPPYQRGNIAFAVNPDGTGCQTGDAGAPPGKVLLYTIQMFNFSNTNVIPSNTYLTVGPGIPPTNPNFNCPLMTNCESPAFPAFCVKGGTFMVNPVGRSCNVAVSTQTWGEVKGLYR